MVWRGHGRTRRVSWNGPLFSPGGTRSTPAQGRHHTGPKPCQAATRHALAALMAPCTVAACATVSPWPYKESVRSQPRASPWPPSPHSSSPAGDRPVPHCRLRRGRVTFPAAGTVALEPVADGAHRGRRHNTTWVAFTRARKVPHGAYPNHDPDSTRPAHPAARHDAPKGVYRESICPARRRLCGVRPLQFALPAALGMPTSPSMAGGLQRQGEQWIAKPVARPLRRRRLLILSIPAVDGQEKRRTAGHLSAPGPLPPDGRGAPSAGFPCGHPAADGRRGRRPQRLEPQRAASYRDVRPRRT